MEIRIHWRLPLYFFLVRFVQFLIIAGFWIESSFAMGNVGLVVNFFQLARKYSIHRKKLFDAPYQIEHRNLYDGIPDLRQLYVTVIKTIQPNSNLPSEIDDNLVKFREYAIHL